MEEKDRDISLENLDRESPSERAPLPQGGKPHGQSTQKGALLLDVTDADGEIWSTKVNART